VKFLGTEVVSVSPGSSRCWTFPSPGIVTVFGPMYIVKKNVSEICISFNRTGIYEVSYVSHKGNQLLLKNILVIVSVRSLNWLEETFMNIIMNLMITLIQVFTNGPFATIFGFGTFGLDYLFLTPQFELKGLYKEILHATIPIAILVLAIDAAYIAIFESRDPLDFLINFLYDFGMWALGTFYGYEIYNIVAGFLNYIVVTCFNVPMLMTYLYVVLGASFAMLLVITAIDVIVFSTSFTAARLLIYIGLLSFLFVGLFRIVLIQALLALLPLIMALWALPYTGR